MPLLDLSDISPINLNELQQDKQELDLSDIAPLDLGEKKKKNNIEIPVSSIKAPILVKKNQLDLSDINPISDLDFNDIAPIDSRPKITPDKNYGDDSDVLRISSAKQTSAKLPTITPDKDNKGLIGRAINNISRMNEPGIKENNPNIVVKELRFSLPANPDGTIPDYSEISNAALSQLGGEYSELGKTFREQTGLNLAQVSPKELHAAVINKRTVDGKTYYDFGVKLTKGNLDLYNAYSESGLGGYRGEYEKQYRLNNEFAKEWKQYEDYHSGFSGDVRRAFGNVAISVGQRLQNLRTVLVPSTFAPSKETSEADQKALSEARANLGSYKTGLGGLVGESINAGAFVAGLGPIPLATVYLDNIHLGQKEALKATAGFALMQAAGHFVGDIANEAKFLPATRQILIRGSQGTTNFLYAALNGDRDLNSLINQGLVGGFFPAGKGEKVDAFTNKLGLSSIKSPIELPKITSTNITPQDIKMNLEDAGVLLSDLKNFRTSPEGRNLELSQASLLDRAIENLDREIPEGFQTWFAKHEKIVRAALQPKIETPADETRVVEKESNSKTTLNNNIEGDSIKPQESSQEFLDRVKERFRDNPTPLPQNRQESVVKSEQRFAENAEKLKIKISDERGFFNFGDKDKPIPEESIAKLLKESASDLINIAAFHVEDFYARKIEPTVDAFNNRLINVFGNGFVSSLGDDRIRTLFEQGKSYYDSNVADPFFSGLKQEVLEKLPNKFNANQARAIIGQEKFKNEAKWTVGLDEFLERLGNGKATKNDLIDVLNSGQVRIEEKVLGEDKLPEGYRIEHQDFLANTNAIMLEYPYAVLDKNGNAVVYGRNESEAIKNINLHLGISTNKTRYGLKDYTGEQLETEGGESYKEFLLISPKRLPDNLFERLDIYLKQNPIYGFDENGKQTRITTNEQLQKIKESNASQYQEIINDFTGFNKTNNSYRSPHWNEENVIAHFRFNERIIDGKKTLFVEEIQSDLHQTAREDYGKQLADYARSNGVTLELTADGVPKDYNKAIKTIREHLDNYNIDNQFLDGIIDNAGYKPKKEVITKENYDKLGYQMLQIPSAFEGNTPIWIFKRKGEAGYIDSIPSSSDGKSTFSRFSDGLLQAGTEEEALDYFIENLQKEPLYEDENLNPRLPFEGFDWKELAVKRILRHAAENGFDKVAWTSSEMQQKRYKKLHEGKQIVWDKNSDGSYSISLTDANGNNHHTPEMDNIPLSRVAELTNAEVTNKIKEQESSKDSSRHWMHDLNAEILEDGKLYLVSRDENGQLKDIVEPSDGNFSTLSALNNWKENHIKAKAGMGGIVDLGETIKIGQGYGDYNKGYPLIFNKIGKRFGAKVGEDNIKVSSKEPIETKLTSIEEIQNAFNEGLAVYNKSIGIVYNTNDELHAIRSFEYGDNIAVEKYEGNTKEKVPSIEITPSMRQSLTKEGQTIYGTSGLGDFPKGAETGIRNKIVTLDNYRQTLSTLEEAATNLFQNPERLGTPEDYAQALLEDRGLKITKNANGDYLLNNEGQVSTIPKEEFVARAKQIDQRISTELDGLTKPLPENTAPALNPDGTIFNSGLNPEEFVKQIKLLYAGIKDFGTFSKLLITKFGDAIKPYLIQFRDWIKDEFKIEGNEESQRGFLNLSPPKNPALEKFLEPAMENLKITKGKKRDIRFAMRSAAVMQLHPDTFGPIWNTLADAEGMTNSYKSKLVQDIHAASRFVVGGVENDVATALYDGDRNNAVWTDPELKVNYNLNPEQIKAYRTIRKAQNRVLEVKLLTKVFPLWQKLSTHVPGSGEYNEILAQINRVEGYYQGLKNRGYVTRQRLGKIAVFAEDPAFPVGSVERKLYTQVENEKEAKATLTQWFNKYKAINGDSHFINKKNMVAELQFLANKVTPAAIENLIDASGVDRNSPEINQLVDEVYQRFPSSSYELKRDYVRGMEETWKNLLINLAHQNEVYSNSYYSKIGGEQAKFALSKLDLLNKDPNLYKIAASYIQDAVTPYEGDWFQKGSAKLRSKVYFMQLGYQFWQFVNNGITQPMQQTYSYFSRIGLEGKEPEHYFGQGLKLAKEAGKENFAYKSTSMPQEFRDIYQRLKDEHLVTQEFTRSLLESEINRSTLDVEKEAGLRKNRLGQKVFKEWPSIFQEKGEITTRTITAAEAYLVGTEKFKLAGEELYKFIRQSIVATQGAFGKSENPYLVRKAGEVGKLFYQFSSYNQMWLENFALAVKSDKELRRFVATPRHILPVLLTAGVKGLPLYAFGKTLYTLLTGKNPEDEFKKALKNHQLLANFALYGVSGNAGVSAKLGVTVPFADNFAQIISDPSQELSFENIPAINTLVQFGTGVVDLAKKGKKLRGLEEVSPAAVKNILKAARYNREGAKTRGGKTKVAESKINGLQKGAQILFGITPSPVVERFEKEKMDKVKKVGKPIRKFLRIGH